MRLTRGSIVGSLGRSRAGASGPATSYCAIGVQQIVFLAAVLMHGGTWFYWLASLYRGSWYRQIDVEHVIGYLRLAQWMLALILVWLLLCRVRICEPSSGAWILLAAFGFHALVLASFAGDFERRESVDVEVRLGIISGYEHVRSLIRLVRALGVIAIWTSVAAVVTSTVGRLRTRLSVPKTPCSRE